MVGSWWEVGVDQSVTQILHYQDIFQQLDKSKRGVAVMMNMGRRQPNLAFQRNALVHQNLMKNFGMMKAINLSLEKAIHIKS